MPSKSANVKNEKQYEKLKDKGMSKERAARIANSPGASSRGGKKSGSGGDASQGGTTAQARSWAQLPAEAIKYVRRIEELIGCPVALLSTSPEREDTILMRNPFET